MFHNHYMKKYQDISRLIGGAVPTRKDGVFILVCLDIPYAVVKRTHLMTNEVIDENMTSYSEGYTKQESCIIEIGNKDYFGRKKGLS